MSIITCNIWHPHNVDMGLPLRAVARRTMFVVYFDSTSPNSSNYYDFFGRFSVLGAHYRL